MEESINQRARKHAVFVFSTQLGKKKHMLSWEKVFPQFHQLELVKQWKVQREMVQTGKKKNAAALTPGFTL